MILLTKKEEEQYIKAGLAITGNIPNQVFDVTRQASGNVVLSAIIIKEFEGKKYEVIQEIKQ